MKALFIVLLFLVSVSSWAGLSPKRLANSDYDNAKFTARALKYSLKIDAEDIQSKQPFLFNSADGAERKKRFLHQVDTSVVKAVSADQLSQIFNYVRDTKFMRQTDNQPRRLTWLYPDDGCYARAAMASYNLDSFPAPSKVFIFGNLRVNTDNAPGGQVEWWYHVAVAYRVDKTVYIIDPAIHPEGPMTVEAWGLTMVKDIRQAKFSICDRYTYDPDSDCTGKYAIPRESAYQEQSLFLPLEWDRVSELGRDPYKELLGDTHPVAAPH